MAKKIWGTVLIFKEILRKIVYWRTFRRLRSYGSNIILSRGGIIERPEELDIGSNVFIARNFQIYPRSMKIGNNVMIGPNFFADCDNHIFDIVGKTIFSVQTIRNIGPITIENDVWIGANVTLLKSVIIGEGSVIGAGSLLTKNMPPYTICYGVPCHPVRPRFSKKELKNHLELTQSKLTMEIILEQWVNARL